jgi:hypothetical protein
MGELDHGAKLALRADPQGLLGDFVPGLTVVRPFPQERVSAMRTVDGTYEVVLPDGRPALAHVEFEAEPTSSIAGRAMRAACTLHVAEELPVRVVVFYLHAAADGRRPLAEHVLPIGEDSVRVRFVAVAVWELDPEAVLAGSIGQAPFVTLSEDATLDHVRRAVDKIGAAPGLSEKTRDELVVATHFLGSYRFPDGGVSAIIPREVLMQSPAYQQLVAEVEAEACRRIRRKILEGLQSRLGPVPTDVRSAIDVAPLEALEGMIVTLIGNEGGDAMARVRAALGLD